MSLEREAGQIMIYQKHHLTEFGAYELSEERIPSDLEPGYANIF
jgi:hypothetical protein